MRLQCTQEALVDALATVGRVVPTKSTLPVLTNVLLEADAVDGLRVVATNLEITVSRRIRATVTAEGRTTAPARLLAEYVALLDRGKQISLKLNPSGHKLHLACERYEANVATLPAEEFPPAPVVNGTIRLEIDGAVLKSAIEQVVFAAELLRATRAATVFARDNSNVVRLECTPPPDDGTPALGQVLVKATSAEMGDNVGKLEASVQGDAGQIAFNGRYLRDALESLDSPQVGLQLTGAHSPGVIRPVGDLEDAHMLVIMPMNSKAS